MAVCASVGAVLSTGLALRLGPAWLTQSIEWTRLGLSLAWTAAVFFALPAIGLLTLYFRPGIEIHETHLQSGNLKIPWTHIRRLDQTGWSVPLIVYLTVQDNSRVLLIFAGDFNSSASVLRHLRRYCREALLDGVPHRQFWGEPVTPERKQLAPPRYPLLRPEDEEEVERMFQRLKSAGNLEHHKQDEK